MSAVVSTVKLHLNRRFATFGVPLTIAATVAIVSVLISLVFWRAGSIPGSSDWVDNSKNNPGIVYALVGFLIYLGVSSVSTTFPFALTLGATRRSFVTGTFAWNLITSAYIAAIFAVLNLIEQATGHWFFGFYIFDVHVLGGGDTGRLLAIVFLGVLVSLSTGGVFAAGWVRFGARGPQLIAVGIVIVLALFAMIVVPELAAIAVAFRVWWLAVAAALVIVISAVGSWLLLRRALVR